MTAIIIILGILIGFIVWIYCLIAFFKLVNNSNKTNHLLEQILRKVK